MGSVDLALLLLFAPLVTALAIVIVAPLRARGRPAAWLSVGTAILSLGCALVLFSRLLTGAHQLGQETVRWLPHAALGHHAFATAAIELGVRLDGVSVSMLCVVTLVALCVQVFSIGYLADEPPADLGRYYAWQSLFLFAMCSLVLAPNLLQLFLGWELVGLVSYLLIGYWWRKPSAARAALKAFWVTKFADMGLVLGLLVLFVSTGSFSWEGPVALATPVTLLLFLGVMGKSAQFPLHVWLPDAMEGPTPVSALLHAATMVAAGVYLVVRADPLFQQAPDTQLVMAYVGSFTALFAAAVAVVQTDIKKVLAYSTCSQLGYMVCALGAGSQVAGFFHLTTHAFFKALLFLAAGSLIHGVHSNELSKMGGLFSRMRLTSIAFIIGALALAGVPGLAGFFSKDLVLEQVMERQLWAPLAALLVAAFLTAFYMGRVVVVALFGPPSHEAEHAHESGATMLAPLVLLSVFALGTGWLGATLSGLYAEEAHFHLSPVGMLASALAFAGLGCAYWMFGAPRGGGAILEAFAPLGRLARSSLVDDTLAWGYRRALTGVADAIGWFDRYVIDGLINLVGWATLAAGDRLRRIQTGRVEDYVYVLVVAVLLAGLYGAFTT